VTSARRIVPRASPDPTVSVIVIAILAAGGYTVANERHGYYRTDRSSYPSPGTTFPGHGEGSAVRPGQLCPNRTEK
jgi:hypothetical protein